MISRQLLPFLLAKIICDIPMTSPIAAPDKHPTVYIKYTKETCKTYRLTKLVYLIRHFFIQNKLYQKNKFN